MPPFDRFKPDPHIHDPKQLAVWKVEGRGAETDFRGLYRGSLIDEAFNDGWTGKTLTEITPPLLQPAIIGASRQCANTGCAVYSILQTYDGDGFAINLERLLLPFGTDGRVQVILASLQLISLHGTVSRRDVVRKFEAHCETAVSITIPAASVLVRHKRMTPQAARDANAGI
ncbi:MAG TPA: hypothetical protein VJV58_02885 [Bradyrhizobium sp.]|uniref:hypothetical protein n=1 Tax=Bradyrhizobium sp. TaxID=376 RepID=UPI002B488119|nr:hypothetical protein [Bradyrhizobium sp.]HKO69856.1 hypothetical protein [Bradyrhizobium sp.]